MHRVSHNAMGLWVETLVVMETHRPSSAWSKPLNQAVGSEEEVLPWPGCRGWGRTWWGRLVGCSEPTFHTSLTPKHNDHIQFSSRSEEEELGQTGDALSLWMFGSTVEPKSR